MTSPSHPPPTSSAQGNLAKTPLIHLLAYVQDRSLSGVLYLSHPVSGEAVLMFDHGWPTKATIGSRSAEGRDLLALAETLLGWNPDTAFTFIPQSPANADGARVDPYPLVWKGAREGYAREHMISTLQRVANAPLVLRKDADLARLSLDPKEMALARGLATGGRTIAELKEAFRDATVDVEGIVYGLLITKQIVIAQKEARHSTRPVPGPLSSKPPPPLDARRGEILARAERIASEDYFSILGLSQDATPTQVQNAYFALAKVWHPDRLSTAIGDVRDACARVFSYMNEAHQTLSDPERRAQYMLLMKDGGASPEEQKSILSVVEATTKFQKAEVLARRNDLVGAESLCREAMEADPTQADYIALYAWVRSLMPQHSHEASLRDLIKLLNKAISIHANCEKAYFYRGMLRKRVGEGDAAISDFRRACELNPRNIDAQREVRLFQLRSAKQGSRPVEQEGRKSNPSIGKERLSGILPKWLKR